MSGTCGKVRKLMTTTPSAKSEKIVIQTGTGTIKGYLESAAWNTIEELLSSAPQSFPESIRIRRLDTDEIEEISIKNCKAVFYVNSFDGNPVRNHLNFHTRA